MTTDPPAAPGPGPGPVPGAGSPPPGRRRLLVQRRLRLVVAAAGLLVVGAIVVGGLWLQGEANPSGGHGPQVIVTVPAGSGSNRIASELEAHRVIGSALAFRIWLVLHGAPLVKPGQYAVDQHESFATVRQVLAAGPNVFSLDVPPGFTVAEVAYRLGQYPGFDPVAFESLTTSGKVRSPWQPAGSANLDGLLGTGMYRLLPGETDRQLLGQMIGRFDTEADQAGLPAGAAALGLTPYQAVTVASIVEKEGVIRQNLGPVARVILNRLSRGMPLQMDATVLYAEGRDGGTVTAKDLQLASPYNSYLNEGLTPTPICFPSPAALAAALHPPAGSWLFFVVVQPDGTEAFADTFAQQQVNEALAQQRGLP